MTECISPLAEPADGSRAAPQFVVTDGEDAYLAADRFTKSVLSGALYRSGTSYAAVYGAPPAPRRVHYFSEARELVAMARFITNVEIEREGRRGVFTVPGALPLPLAEAFLSSPAFDSLPPLDAVFTSPRIVFDEAGRPRLHSHGYEKRTRSLYLPDSPVPVEPSTSTLHLKKCFSGMPWRTDEDRRRFLGWLLGSFLYDSDIVRPLLVVESNSQRAGKSSLCYAAGRILDGKDPVSLKPGPELEKRLAALLSSNDTFGLLDNVVSKTGTFDSVDLSSALTTPGKISIRRLCTNSMIAGGGLVFAMTVNDARLSRDLTTRAVPVSLIVEEGETKPHVPYAPEYAAAHRVEILAELLGLALSDPPPVPKITSRFVAWERFVRPRIAAAFGDVELGAEFTDSPIDAVLLALIAFGIEHLGKPFSLPGLAEAICDARACTALEPIQTALESSAGERGRSAKLQRALERISNGPFRAFGGVYRLVRRNDEQDRPAFVFEEAA